MTENFNCPGLPFSDNFDKGTPPPPSKMFTFVFVSINLIMDKIQRDSVLCPAEKQKQPTARGRIEKQIGGQEAKTQ